MTDLRSISIQYENKINGLYALFVSLERVNMCYIEKMKSRNNNPQTAKQQLKARLQICKNMKQVLKNTKKYEDVLTDEQKNLLPNSCNIDPLKPRFENLTELISPYFKKPPTKPAPIPNLLTKDKFTSEISKEKLPKISTSTDTTASPEVLLPQIQASPPNECSPTAISAKSKQLHPWCRITRRQDEMKDKSTEKTHPAMKPNKIEYTNPSRKIQNSSNSTEIEHPEDSKDQIETSSHTDLREIRIMLRKSETVKEQEEVKETKESELFPSPTHQTIPQQKAKIKYTEKKIFNPPVINTKKVLSIVEYEEAYPWGKDAAKNRQMKSPLSEKTRKIRKGIDKLLPPVMKKELYQQIDYPDSIYQKIHDKIKKEDGKYNCNNCNNYSTDQ